VVYGDDERVSKWVSSRVPEGGEWGGYYQAVGLENHGNLIAGVVYNSFSTANVNMHLAGEGDWLHPAFARAAFHYPFGQLKVRRVTSLVASSNRRCQRLIEALGFKYEARLERGLPDEDLLVYRLFPEDSCLARVDQHRNP
jgi:RimJ/RimL family protein N-acetyltransferase